MPFEAFTINDAYPFQNTVSVGETLYMHAIIENIGSEVGDATAQFKFDGETVRTRTHIVKPGEEITFQQQITHQELQDTVGNGDFTLSVKVVDANGDKHDDFTDGTVTVSTEFDSSAVSVVSCTDSPSEVNPGDSVTVTLYLSNQNDASADATIEIQAGTETKTVTASFIPANSFDYQRQFDIPAPLETGTHEVRAEVISAQES